MFHFLHYQLSNSTIQSSKNNYKANRLGSLVWPQQSKSICDKENVIDFYFTSSILQMKILPFQLVWSNEMKKLLPGFTWPHLRSLSTIESLLNLFFFLLNLNLNFVFFVSFFLPIYHFWILPEFMNSIFFFLLYNFSVGQNVVERAAGSSAWQ